MKSDLRADYGLKEDGNGKRKPPAADGAPPREEVYFDTRSRDYFMQVAGRWRQMSARDVKLHLRKRGHSDSWDGPTFDHLKACEWIMADAQESRPIDYAGSLAGHRAGVFKDSFGNAFLVTNEPPGIWEPVPKKRTGFPKRFLAFLEALLPDPQHWYFLHWLSVSLQSLRACDFRPGQLVCLAGPGGSGKSLLQIIVTEVLGGRVGSPFSYMMGETQFNSELAGAEHWVIEDPPSSTDIRTRRLFGAKLKEATVNKFLKIHPKGKEAITLPVFRRVTVSVNEEPENLSVLPPLDDSILDKVFLFLCGRGVYGDKPEDREVTYKAVLEDVPGIRQGLLTLGPIPKEMRKRPDGEIDTRFLVGAWHHPHLLGVLADLAPETRLWDMLTHALWRKPGEAGVVWTGKAIELEKRLKEDFSDQEVERLLKNPNSCGTYLARLAHRYPRQISKGVKDGVARWTLTPPSKTATES